MEDCVDECKGALFVYKGWMRAERGKIAWRKVYAALAKAVFARARVCERGYACMRLCLCVCVYVCSFVRVYACLYVCACLLSILA